MHGNVLERREHYIITEVPQAGPDNTVVVLLAAWNKAGAFIGTPDEAERLVDELGILPELAKPEDSVCTIGFCTREQKWYGWSRRILCGYGIGDVFIGEDSQGWGPATTLDEAKQMAIETAELADA
ncbi:MAG TPA: hypothetical protein PLF11_00005 [Bacillota bacterium]|nr:hypothetical protein [Dermatophilaceae bacterium]HOI35741.1 hypothetical protein [Bacillota bacterium]